MSFEKQICFKCKQLTICYHHESKDWYCDNCYGWVIEEAHHKDKIREIFCGIEDIEEPMMEEPIHDIRDLD